MAPEAGGQAGGQQERGGGLGGDVGVGHAPHPQLQGEGEAAEEGEVQHHSQHQLQHQRRQQGAGQEQQLDWDQQEAVQAQEDEAEDLDPHVADGLLEEGLVLAHQPHQGRHEEVEAGGGEAEHGRGEGSPGHHLAPRHPEVRDARAQGEVQRHYQHLLEKLEEKAHPYNLHDT